MYFIKFKTSFAFQLFTYFSIFPLIIAITKTVSFSDEKECNAYRTYIESGNDVYKVVWNGEKYPKYCTLRFKMRGIDTYKLCAKVTTFNLECERYGDPKRRLKFYWGVNVKEKYYDCNSKLPITYCNEDNLFMTLEPRYDVKPSASTIRITVTAELVSKYGDSWTNSSTSSSNTGIIVGVTVGIVIFMLIICLAICKNRASQRQNASNCVVQRQGNNVYVATTAPYQQNQFGGPLAYQHQQQHGEQSVPLVQYPAAGSGYPNQYPPPMSTGQSSQHGYPGYPPMVAGQSPQSGFYGQMHGPSAPANQHYGEQVQYPTEAQPHDGPKSIASAPPPSYSDVMEKGSQFRQ